jgi:hypothetical protein
MKYIFSTFLLLCFFAATSQHILSDSTYFVVESGKTFQVDVTNYVNGGQDLKKREVSNLREDFANRIFPTVNRWEGLFHGMDGVDEKIQKLIRENQRIANQTGMNHLDTVTLAARPMLVGTWNILDYDRASTVTLAVNASGVLRWGGAQGGQVVALIPTVAYLRGWKGLWQGGFRCQKGT